MLTLGVIGSSGLVVYYKIDAKDSRVMNSWSRIEAHLIWRYQLVPILRQTLESLDFDDSSLDDVIRAHNSLGRARGVNERIKAYTALEEGLDKLYTVIESHPEVTEDPLYIDVTGRIDRNLRSIAGSDVEYNKTAAEFNEHITAMPASLIAGLTGMRAYLVLPEAPKE